MSVQQVDRELNPASEQEVPEFLRNDAAFELNKTNYKRSTKRVSDKVQKFFNLLARIKKMESKDAAPQLRQAIENFHAEAQRTFSGIKNKRGTYIDSIMKPVEQGGSEHPAIQRLRGTDAVPGLLLFNGNETKPWSVRSLESSSKVSRKRAENQRKYYQGYNSDVQPFGFLAGEYPSDVSREESQSKEFEMATARLEEMVAQYEADRVLLEGRRANLRESREPLEDIQKEKEYLDKEEETFRQQTEGPNPSFFQIPGSNEYIVSPTKFVDSVSQFMLAPEKEGDVPRSVSISPEVALRAWGVYFNSKQPRFSPPEGEGTSVDDFETEFRNEVYAAFEMLEVQTEGLENITLKDLRGVDFTDLKSAFAEDLAYTDEEFQALIDAEIESWIDSKEEQLTTEAEIEAYFKLQ